MSIFQKSIGPVFLKENSDITGYISKMQELEKNVTDKKLKSEISEQLRNASYGELGEESIIFELKNSGIDMYILRDIYLEYEDLYAQIVFLIVTRKKVFILECKNMYGDISIDEKGNFVRTTKWNRSEGIYSPVTQNQRHLNVIKTIRSNAKGNILTKTFFERNFENNYKSLVVLANDKTILNADKAPEDVVSHVIKKDQLNRVIKNINGASKDPEYTNEEMKELAQFFLDASTPNKSDYSEKYEKLVEQVEVLKNSDKLFVKNSVVTDSECDKICPKCKNKLILRTANKGKNIGKQFYGCSAFPKCWYKEDIPETAKIEDVAYETNERSPC